MNHPCYFYHNHNQYQQASTSSENKKAKIEYSISDYYSQYDQLDNNNSANINTINNYSEYASNENKSVLLNDQSQSSNKLDDFNVQNLDNNNSSSLNIPRSNNSDPRSNSTTSDFSIDSLTSNSYNNSNNTSKFYFNTFTTTNNNNNNNNESFDLLDFNKLNNRYFQHQAAISNYEPIINEFENDDFSSNTSSININTDIKQENFNNNELSNDGNISNCNYHEHNISSISNSGKVFHKFPAINYNSLANSGDKADFNNFCYTNQFQYINMTNLISDHQAINIDYNSSYLSNNPTQNQIIYKQHLHASSPNIIDKSLPSSSNSSASSSFCNYDSYSNSNNSSKNNNELNYYNTNQIDLKINNKNKDQNENIISDCLSRKTKTINFQHIDFKYPTDPINNKNIKVKLEDAELWNDFNRVGTEMLITKPGRRMFPFIRYRVSGLDKRKNYIMFVDLISYDTNRYKFINNEWKVVSTNETDNIFEERCFIHSDSPMNGESWMKQILSFNKIKLTNNKADKSGLIILNSMHKYIPRLHIVEEGKSINTFLFEETAFIAVTSYQNSLITKLKIDNNPFARGFRDERKKREKRGDMNNYEDCSSLNDSIDLVTPIVV